MSLLNDGSCLGWSSVMGGVTTVTISMTGRKVGEGAVKAPIAKGRGGIGNSS